MKKTEAPTQAIPKVPVREKSEDYAFLRKAGLEHIEKLASALWTDYNAHDPGITILELLCYAITDLGLRTGYSVEDILAENETDQKKGTKNFFTAREVLPCNPVTENDFRKLAIDVPGVRNAWLEIVEKPQPELYIDCKKSRLTLEKKADELPLFLQGLYTVVLELADDPELGDLNLVYFKREIDVDGREIEIEATLLPAWDFYFNSGIDPEEIKKLEFTPLQPVSGANQYNTKLVVTTKSGDQFQRPVVIYTDAEKSAANTQAIEAELADTGDDGILPVYLKMIRKGYAIAVGAHDVLQAHRNLCEDYYRFESIDIEEVGVCADIEVAPEADVEEILARIHYDIADFLAPAVRFKTLEEMLESGKTADEIFDGPALNHGFIDDDDLSSSRFLEYVNGSDLVQILMDIPGIAAVKSLLMTGYYNGQEILPAREWRLEIEKGRAVRFSADFSKFVFFKGLTPFYADSEEAAEKLRERKAMDRAMRLGKDDYDLPIPEGEYRDIENYYSIQNDFPLCYGVGKEGLPDSATDERKAQAKQLKAFLLFFEQILADYLSQLARVRDLFSMDPDMARTYFGRPMFQVPGHPEMDLPDSANLQKTFMDSLDPDNNPDIDPDKPKTYETQWNAYLKSVKQELEQNDNRRDPFRESVQTNIDRKNRFLDHLLAQFCESFAEYALVMYSMGQKKAQNKTADQIALEVIADKLAFVNDYPAIGRDRGKAFDYKQGKTFFSDNVSGLERRISRLLGLDNIKRKYLRSCLTGPFEIYLEQNDIMPDGYRWRLKDDMGKVLLSSSVSYDTEEQALYEIMLTAHFGRDKAFYEKVGTVGGKFCFNIVDETGEVIARRLKYFATEPDIDEAIDKTVAFLLSARPDCEGFHLVEHILLRPFATDKNDDSLMAVCVDSACDDCAGRIDPYSFRATAVLPYWPERFLNMDFRKYFEMAMRMEAPAHVHVKVCWVDEDDMELFESRYFPWLREMARPRFDIAKLTKARDDLVVALRQLRSVYPQAVLYDCEARTSRPPVLLGHSVLGSIDSGSME